MIIQQTFFKRNYFYHYKSLFNLNKSRLINQTLDSSCSKHVHPSCSCILLHAKTFYSFSFSEVKNIHNKHVSTFFKTNINAEHTSNIEYYKQIRNFGVTNISFLTGLKNSKKKIKKVLKFRPKGIKLEVATIKTPMTVLEIASELNRKVDDIFEAMLYIPNTSMYEEESSVIYNIDVIKEICKKCGFRFKLAEKKSSETKLEENDVLQNVLVPQTCVSSENWPQRPPVVTIMGHVDHGKTTLIDFLRKSNVADNEYGGITQHIGAFNVNLQGVTKDNRSSGSDVNSLSESVTFLDTPGHAVFHAMRSRGAQVTDIIVLVIAVNDGVMPQTRECISHATSAGVPIIVAINKIDKFKNNKDKVSAIEEISRSLLAEGIVPESLGGETQIVEISALKGDGIADLLESVLALAEVMNLSAPQDGAVEAVVIESKSVPGRGKVASLLVQRGSLKPGDIILAGRAWAKVRGMFDDRGRPVRVASPGTPVEVLGWRDHLPSPGTVALQARSETGARSITELRRRVQRDELSDAASDAAQQRADTARQTYLEQRELRRATGIRSSRAASRLLGTGGAARPRETDPRADGDTPELCVLIKADVDGSLEAILDTLRAYDSSQCRLSVLDSGVGVVSEHDVQLAATFNGVVYTFNLASPPPAVSQSALKQRVEIEPHRVIYRLLESLRTRLQTLLPPLQVEHVLGEARVLQLFEISEGRRKVPVAGCRCDSGLLRKKAHFRLMRSDETMHEGAVKSLRHFKSEVESVASGLECGVAFSDMDAAVRPQPGDTIVCYEMRAEPQQLDWHLDF